MTTQHPASDGPVPPTTPPDPGIPGSGAAPAPRPNGFFQAIRGTGLYRTDDRWIGGVAGGLAARFGLDPLLVRGAFVVTLLLGGFGLVLYALGWALLPEQRDGRIHLEGLTLGHPDIALLGALLMFLAGVGNGAWVRWPVHVPGWLQGLFWIGATVLVIVVVAQLASHRRPAPPYTGPLPLRDVPVPPAFTGPAGPAAPPSYGPAPQSPAPHTPAASVPATSSPGAPITMSVPPTAPPPPAQPYAGPAHQGPTHPYRYAAQPPVPPRPPVVSYVPPPPKPRRRGPGATITGITVALALFVVAGTLIAERVGWLDRSTAATAAALIVVIFGAAIIVAGLRGRTGGVLGFLAVVAMLVAIPMAFAARSSWNWSHWEANPDAIHAGPGTTVVDDRDSARDGIQVGFGDATVDLTEVPLDDGDPLVVPIRLGAGDFTILVPKDARATATVDVGAGQVTWRVGGDDASSGGLGVNQQTFGDTDDPQLDLQVQVGAGNVTIEEGD